MAMMTTFSKCNSHQAEQGPVPGQTHSASPAGQPQTQSQWLPRAGQNIEILSQDSDSRGCWFRCKVLRLLQKGCMKYLDVHHVDGPGKLEERVPVSRVADPDSAGMRCLGRLTVRPWPDWDSTDFRYEFGMAADAWCRNGWWECIVLCLDTEKPSCYQVFLPGKGKFDSVLRENMRVSRDWVENKWVSIERKTDILVFLTESFNRQVITTTPLPVVAGQANNSAPPAGQADNSFPPAGQADNSAPPTNTKVLSSSVSRDVKLKMPSLSSASQKGDDGLELKKQPIVRENEGSSRKRGRGAGKGGRKAKSVKNRRRVEVPNYIIALPVPPSR